MRPRIPLLAFALTLLALSCADAASDEPAGSSAEAVSSVACGAALPGPALMPGAVEGAPGFAAALAATDLTRVPEQLDLAASQGFVRAVGSYMLGRSGASLVSKADALGRGGLGRTVVASAARGENGELDATFLRQGLHHHYLCETAIPASLGALSARYGDYRAWPSFDIPCSRAKDGPRRVYEDETQGVFVAETLADGGVRETEVIFSKLRTDGQLDFAAYTEKGELTDRSTFAAGSHSVTLAAPFTCMTCHFDRNTVTFTRRFPFGTGTGCASP